MHATATTTMTDDTQLRRLATIVALDVAGYSARTEADEAKTTAEVAALRRLIEEIAEGHEYARVFGVVPGEAEQAIAVVIALRHPDVRDAPRAFDIGQDAGFALRDKPDIGVLAGRVPR